MRHLLSLFEVTGAEIEALLDSAIELKEAFRRREYQPQLAGRTVALIFEKPSLRTRASFEAGIAQLGGASLFLAGSDIGLGNRESVADMARTLSEYVDAVVLRTFAQQTIEDFARYASCSVINGLSNRYHPCQALGDLLTVRELFGTVKNKTIVFVGDGNNVARSLAIACAKVGARLILAAPDAYRFDTEFLDLFRAHGLNSPPEQTSDLEQAVAQADVIYTDVWASMGQEAEHDERCRQLGPYQVNAALLAKAPPHAKVMHCLPARRGEEITSDVLDGDRSVVFQQAGNRMHVQKALLKWLLTS